MRAGGFGDDVDSRPEELKRKGRDVRVGDDENIYFRLYRCRFGGLRGRALAACFTPTRGGAGGSAVNAAADW